MSRGLRSLALAATVQQALDGCKRLSLPEAVVRATTTALVGPALQAAHSLWQRGRFEAHFDAAAEQSIRVYGLFPILFLVPAAPGQCCSARRRCCVGGRARLRKPPRRERAFALTSTGMEAGRFVLIRWDTADGTH